jgi:1-deoxy-D-xylulose-5-phosphate reductoisomerase
LITLNYKHQFMDGQLENGILMKHLCILGSTGSIGQSTLKVVEAFPDRFCITALSAKTRVDLLAEQIIRFSPEIAVVFDAAHAVALEKRLPKQVKVEILHGEAGYKKAASAPSVDMVVTAMVGAAGLLPTLAAIDAGKDIALSNKETLVMAGHLVMNRASRKGVRILPVDSEHSAIFQSLQGHRREDLDQIHLTASGGPFRSRPKAEFPRIRPKDALKHPNWNMGRKITIDSATLMNKGLEVIEARFLFDVPPERISVVVHPQSIIHSMVSYRDGSLIAQLGVPDMRGAIAYALSYPERLSLGLPLPDFPGIGALTFEEPDLDRFPCLSLAFRACKTGGTLPAVLNAANEAAVEAFLAEQIQFVHIPKIIADVMDRHTIVETPELATILASDHWARETAAALIHELGEAHS